MTDVVSTTGGRTARSRAWRRLTGVIGGGGPRPDRARQDRPPADSADASLLAASTWAQADADAGEARALSQFQWALAAERVRSRTALADSVTSQRTEPVPTAPPPGMARGPRPPRTVVEDTPPAGVRPVARIVLVSAGLDARGLERARDATPDDGRPCVVVLVVDPGVRPRPGAVDALSMIDDLVATSGGHLVVVTGDELLRARIAARTGVAVAATTAAAMRLAPDLARAGSAPDEGPWTNVRSRPHATGST